MTEQTPTAVMSLYEFEQTAIGKAITDLRGRTVASDFSPGYSGQRGQDFDRGLLAAATAVRAVLPSTPTPAPDAVAEGLRDAMENDPFVDDIPLMGTTQQSQRIAHYASVVLAALPASQPVADVETLNGIILRHTVVGGYPDTRAIAREAYALGRSDAGRPLTDAEQERDAYKALSEQIANNFILEGRERAAQVATLTARVETLEGALLPFAKVADEYDRWQAMGSTSCLKDFDFAYGQCRFGLTEYRKARAALSPDPAVKPSAEGGAA